MTEDIKKALELYKHTRLYINEDKKEIYIADALDLINRLQAENERLKPFEDKIAEFNSHIRVEDMLVFASSLGEWLEFMQKTKAEAIKEFAEKVYRFLCNEKTWHILKESWLTNGECGWLKQNFDNLLKEMGVE